MPGPTSVGAAAGRASLSLLEAAARAAQLDVHLVEVELDLTDPLADTFGSRTTIHFASRGPDTFADFAGATLVAATLNGRPLDPGAWQRGRIALAGLEGENTLVVDGRMAYSTDGEGLHRHTDPVDGRTYLYAMSFLEAAPRWFACFDQPDLKARYAFDVLAPEEWTVLGNGPAQGGRGRWRIEPAHPLSTYFVTLVAGPYASVLAEHDGIRLGLHIRQSLRAELEAQAPDMLEVTAGCFDYYHRVFGVRYPFGDYHQAFVPEFNAGAMENPGCVTFRDGLVPRGRVTRGDRLTRAAVIAHEMAHQWFGDLVTMRWWDDLWLNESFAEYLAHTCCEEATRYPQWTEFGIVRKDWGGLADQSPSTHPVAGNAAVDAASALQNFDGISYAKGAAVLKQLAAYLGEEVFIAGLRDYIDRFSYGNATFADLLAAWTAAGAHDLEAWARAWLRTTGMDTLDVVPADGGVRVASSAPESGSTRPHTVEVGAVDGVGALRRIGRASLNGSDPPVLAVPESTVLVVPDAGDDTWAKIRFGPYGWSGVRRGLPGLADETAAVVVYNAVRDAVRDADLDPTLALDICEAALPTVTDELIWQPLLAFALDQLAGVYAPVAAREARTRRVRALAGRMLDGSEPDSDARLMAFRLVVRCAEDPALLTRWYAGRDLPAGVTLDPELAWLVVERACSLTPATPLLADALLRDATASGRVHAARARARRPDPEAKSAAWALLTQPSSASAYELYATGDGFWDPTQSTLTAPYVARYFTEIGATARFREGWALKQVAVAAFPRTAAHPDALAAADAALAGDLAPPVRRALVDGTDLLRRAVRSLERFAPAAPGAG